MISSPPTTSVFTSTSTSSSASEPKPYAKSKQLSSKSSMMSLTDANVDATTFKRKLYDA